MARNPHAWAIVVALSLTGCTLDTEATTGVAGSQPSADEFDRDPVSLEDSTMFVQHSERLTVEVPSCNGRPVVDEVRETATEGRIRVLTNTDSSAECLDGVSVPLEAPLGDRAVIDDVSGSELRLTER